MKRPVKSSDGLYHIKGKTYKAVRGSRVQVWNRNAYKTEGGLLRSELIKSNGRIVSLKKHKTAKKELRLQKYGYFAQKGKFGYVKKDVTRKRRGTKKQRGGEATPAITTPTLGGSELSHSMFPTASASTSAAPTQTK
jgi:hypothetical protein